MVFKKKNNSLGLLLVFRIRIFDLPMEKKQNLHLASFTEFLQHVHVFQQHNIIVRSMLHCCKLLYGAVITCGCAAQHWRITGVPPGIQKVGAGVRHQFSSADICGVRCL